MAGSLPGRLPFRLGGPSPSGPFALFVAAVAAIVSITAPAPTISAGSSVTISAPAAIVSITAPAPTIALALALPAPAALVSISAPAPNVRTSAFLDIAAPAALVAVSAPAPSLVFPVRVGAPASTVSVSAPYPILVGAIGSAGSALRVDMQWGLIDLTPYITGLTISERMGSPDTLSLQLADLDSAIALSVISTLADIRVRLGTDELFRGQITVPTTETINWQEIDGTWVASRTIDIAAESYERLIPDALISVAEAGISRIMPDGSVYYTIGNSMGWGRSDRDDVIHSIFGWWNGSHPVFDVDSCVFVTGHSSYWWQYPSDNLTMSAAFDALAANASVPTVIHWLDARLRFHWVDGADPGTLEPAPFAISSVGFGWPTPGLPTNAVLNATTVMATKMTISTDAQSLRGRAYVAGALPWVVGLVDNPATAAYAPDASISSGKALTWDDAEKFALRFFANDSRVGLTGTATIPEGYDGWHKGQWVIVTDPGHDLAEHGFLIQGVTARLIGGSDFEYDVTFGDAPRRSLASESANPDIPVYAPAVRYAMRTDPEQSTPTPGHPVTIIAQLHDGIKNLATAGIHLRWDLIIGGGMAEADPTDTTLAYYLEDAIGTTNEQGQALTVAHTGTAFDPTAGLACTVEAVTEAPA